MLVTIPPPPKEPTSSRLWDEYEDKFFQGINHGCIPSRDKVPVLVWRCDVMTFRKPSPSQMTAYHKRVHSTWTAVISFCVNGWRDNAQLLSPS